MVGNGVWAYKPPKEFKVGEKPAEGSAGKTN